jgi:hypothetical protein
MWIANDCSGFRTTLRPFNGKMMWKTNCNDFITTTGGRAWQTFANGLRCNQAETRRGGRPTICVVVSMKMGGASILSSFAGNILAAMCYVNARKPLHKGARMFREKKGEGSYVYDKTAARSGRICS